MAVIDADAHVLETEHTWDYMLESERDMRPRIVPTPNDAISGGESWLVDGTYIGKARNVGHDTSRERARDGRHQSASQAHGRARHRRPGALSDDFSAAVYAPAGGRAGGDAQLQPLADRYLESRRRSACAGSRCCRS